MMLRALLCHCCPVPPPQPVHMYCGIPLPLGSITASTLAQRSLSAMLGGVVFLDESLTVRTIFSALAGADWHCDGDTRNHPVSR
jgi:hypothetical protein